MADPEPALCSPSPNQTATLTSLLGLYEPNQDDVHIDDVHIED
jgi:hypothetical protein